MQTGFVSDKTLNDYYSSEYMPEIANFDFDHWRGIRRPQAEAQLSFIEHHAPIGRGAKVLDYGAATGELVAVFRERTDEVFAFELDPKFRNRLAELSAGTLDEADFHGDRYRSFFDVVTMSHVLEHLQDPYRTATVVYDILKPGGWFFVEVPNEDRVVEQTSMIGSGHIWFFNPDTIKAFFETHGMFELVGIRCDGLSTREYIDGLKRGIQLQPRQDLIDTPDGGNLRLMLRKPLSQRDRPTRPCRPMDWQAVAAAQEQQIGYMFKLLLEYNKRLQAARQEADSLRNTGKPPAG